MAALLFISFIVLLLIGVPVAFAIAPRSLKRRCKAPDPRAAYVRQHRFLLPDRGSVLHLCR